MDNVTIELKRDGKTPMYEELYAYFTAQIRAGVIATGEKLPSKRALSAHLGVSMSTVEAAYSLLVAEGYVYAKPQSGYYCAEFAALEAVEGKKPAPVENKPAARKPEFDFSTASVDTSLFPYSSWAKLNREVVYSSPELLQRGERQGDRALREALAAFLSEYRGVRCEPGEIVIGAGLEYLGGLIAQLMPPGAVFGVEDPGYTTMYSALLSAGHAVRFLPLDAGGLSVKALRETGVDVAYTTPSHQFPMGVTMPAGRRSQLLRWASEREGRYIIEDDYDSEFRYTSRPVPAMQGMDKSGRVIYVGTFSRSVAPSIRVAYMVLPPELLRRYRELSGFRLSTVSRYEQAVIARFLSEGFYARYLRRVGKLYSERRERLKDALEKIEGVTVSGSGGGIHFLITNPRFSERELLERAREKGVELTGISAYCHETPPPESTLIAGYGGLEDGRIEEAAKRLREAWG